MFQQCPSKHWRHIEDLGVLRRNGKEESVILLCSISTAQHLGDSPPPTPLRTILPPSKKTYKHRGSDPNLRSADTFLLT